MIGGVGVEAEQELSNIAKDVAKERKKDKRKRVPPTGVALSSKQVAAPKNVVRGQVGLASGLTTRSDDEASGPAHTLSASRVSAKTDKRGTGDL